MYIYISSLPPFQACLLALASVCSSREEIRMKVHRMHVLMRDEKEGRKQARSNKQQGKATQHTQGSHFPDKNELPQVGLKPTTLYTLD